MTMTKRELWKLRQEITLGSYFLSDYENTFGFDKEQVCDFFDGYADYLQEIMREDHIPDSDFWNELEKYDNADNLYGWWLCFENAPLTRNNYRYAEVRDGMYASSFEY